MTVAVVVSGCFVNARIDPSGLAVLPGRPDDGSGVEADIMERNPAPAWTPYPEPRPTPTVRPPTVPPDEILTPRPEFSPRPTPGPPVLYGVDPDNGGVGAYVTLSGINFGATEEASFEVYFNSGQFASDHIRTSDEEIRAQVPPGANSGNIRLFVGGSASSRQAFFRVLKTLTLDRGDIELRLGESAWYVATAKDAADAAVAAPALTWSVASGSAVTVAAGKVTAIAAGDATIRVASGYLEAVRNIHCYSISGVKLDKGSLTLNAMPGEGTPDPRFKVGDRLVATVQASDGTAREVDWSSSDPTRVTVDAAGWVQTARDAEPGTAIVTAAAADDPRYKATASVTVTDQAGGDIWIY